MTAHAAFDAFLSYSRKDLRFAVELERALERYTPPREIRAARRPIAVCRDQDDLTGPEYHAAIKDHLTRSKKLILICSPHARASEFVNDEIRRFAAIHGAGGIVPVLFAGVPNNAARDGDEANLAFPDALCELVAMPLAIPYTGFDADRDRVTKGVFYGAWYTLLATLLDVDRAAIEERDRRRRARVRNSWIGGTTGVIAALSALTLWAVIERNTAIRRGQVTLAQRLAAQAGTAGPLEPDAAERRTILGVEAVRRLESLGEPTYDAANALRNASALVPRHVVHLNGKQRDVLLSGDGLTLFSTDGPNVTVHSLRSGVPTATLTAQASVSSLFASEDGRLLGGVADDGRLALWQGPNWSTAPVVPRLEGGRVVCGALSANGRYLAALAVDQPPGTNARLVVWRTDSGRVVAQERLATPNGVVRPADDDCLQIGDDHLVARFQASDRTPAMTAALWQWRPDTEVHPSIFRFGSRPRSAPRLWRDVVQAAWATDSSFLILLRIDGSVTTVPVDGRAESVRSGRDEIAHLSADGETLVRVHWEEDPYVPLLKSTTYTSIDRRSNTARGVVAEASGGFALSPDGTRMVTGGGTRLRLWRSEDGRELMRISASGSIAQMGVSRAARYITTRDTSGGADVWDVGHPSELVRVPRGRVAAASADGRRIAVGTPLGVFVVDVVSGQTLASIPLGGGAGLVALNRDGRYLVASGGDPRGFNFGREPLRTIVLDLARPADTSFVGTKATGAVFSPDGASLLLGTSDSVVRMIDVSKRTVRWEKRFDGVATRFTFSADGRTAAAAIEPPTAGVIVVAISPQTGAELRRVVNRKTNALALSPDGSELATASAALVEVTRVRDGVVVTRLTHPSTLETVRHIGFLPGNRVMSVAGNVASTFIGASFFTEQAVFIWNRASGTVERRLPEGTDRAGEYSATLTEEEKPYFSEITWSPNGNEVAAVVFPSRLNYWVVPAPLTSAELRVWRLDAPAPEEVFRATTDGAPRLLSLDDSAGLLFTADAAVRAWSYRARGLVEETCRRVTRTLTPAEWRTFIGPNESPRATCP